MKKLLVLAALLGSLAVVGTAAADSGNGAVVVRDETCIASPLITWCWNTSTVTNMTTTPSGAVSYVTNGEVVSTTSIPLLGCTSTKTEPVHLHWLRQDGEEQSHSERIGQTNSFACADGYSYSCTSSFELHEANGEVQFQRPEFTCTTD